MDVNKGQVIWILLNQLFALNYSEIAAASDGAATPRAQPPLRRRGAAIIKHGTLYRRKVAGNSGPRQTIPPQQGTIEVTFYPLVPSPHCEQRISVLLGLAEKREFIALVAVAACGYRVESTEYSIIPASLQAIVDGCVQEGVRVTWEEQYQALTLLCWMASLHCHSAERQSIDLVVDVVSQFLVSLLCSAFIHGNRQLSHKCTRLITILQR